MIKNRGTFIALNGTKLIWNVVEGHEIVYLIFNEDEDEEDIDIVCSTTSYSEAKKAYENEIKKMK